MRALMWFKSDLRVKDNTALHHACKAAGNGVIGVFAVCPKQWADHDWGSMKVDFVLRNVRALSEALAKLNIPLKLVRTGLFTSVTTKLLQVAKQNRCNALFFNRLQFGQIPIMGFNDYHAPHFECYCLREWQTPFSVKSTNSCRFTESFR